MDLTGCSVMVTGASSGIGRETAILISNLGARVALVGRSRERLEVTRAALAGDGHHLFPFDLADLEAIPAFMGAVAAQVGPLTGLVHAAGIHFFTPLRTLTAARIDQLLRLNYSSALLLAKAFRQKGNCAPGSSIVFVSSSAALVGESALCAYAGSKAALIGAARSLAIELAPECIRVNCVAPGFVDSEMTRQIRQSVTPEQFAAIAASHPLGLGSVRDAANAIAFLIADTARWITGSVLVVDGGYSAC